eukprot:g1109.t1
MLRKSSKIYVEDSNIDEITRLREENERLRAEIKQLKEDKLSWKGNISLAEQILSLKEGAEIPTSIRLLHAAMTQKAVMSLQFKANKANESRQACQNILDIMVEKAVYQKDIDEARERVQRYELLNEKFMKRSEELSLKFDQIRDKTQHEVWPNITKDISEYNRVTHSTITADKVSKSLHAFMELFEEIAETAPFQGVGVSQPIPNNADPESLEYFCALYKDAFEAKSKLDTFGQSVIHSSLDIINKEKEHLHLLEGEEKEKPLKWSIGPLKTVNRSLEKVMDGYNGKFNYLGDIARGSIQCVSLHSACVVLKVLLEEQAKGTVQLVRCKNRFDPKFNAEQGGGYRDGLINATFPGQPEGHIVEIQIHMRDFIIVKKGGGHASYKAARALHLADPNLLTYRGELTNDVVKDISGGLIQELYLDYCEEMDKSVLQELCRSMERKTCLLRTLSFRCSGITDEDCVLLSNSMKVNPLEKIIIAGDTKTKSKVTMKGFVSIIEANANILEYIDFDSSTFDKVEVNALFETFTTFQCNSICFINVAASNLIGELNPDVEFWKFAKHLQVLNVEENKISGTLPEILADNTELPALEELYVGHNKNLGGRISEEFASAPSLKIFDITGTGLIPGKELFLMGQSGEITILSNNQCQNQIKDNETEAMSIIVSDAGTEDANGVYLKESTYHGRPTFRNETTNYKMWWSTRLSLWCLGKLNSFAHVVKKRSHHPPTIGWVIAKEYCDESLCQADVKEPVPRIEIKF